MIRPTRTTGSIGALALALSAVALVLVSPTAILAAGSLALLLIWRGWRFESDLAAATATLTVTRDLDRMKIRQGATATIRVRADCIVPAGMTIRVRDIPPAVAVGDAPSCDPGEAATYTVRLMAPGEASFGGVVLAANDTFFVRDIICRRHDIPRLRVFPAETPEAGRGMGLRGEETEVDRKAALTGQGVRGFRPYRKGDDPRQVDWKVTAKRDALYVRELTGLEGGAPLIAVDLPVPGDGDPAAISRFSMAVYGAVEGAIRSREGCSLLVVAGGEVVRFLPRTLVSREAFAALGELAPIEPRVPLYRAPGTARRAKMGRRGANPEEKAYREKLDGILSAFSKDSTPFTMAIRMAIDRADAPEIKIYSLLSPGDKSHLLQLIHEAKVRGMRVALRTPAGSPLPGIDIAEAF